MTCELFRIWKFRRSNRKLIMLKLDSSSVTGGNSSGDRRVPLLTIRIRQNHHSLTHDVRNEHRMAR